MKLKLLLFAVSLFAVLSFSSQNVNAACTYTNPLYATMTPLDKVNFQKCVNFYPQTDCDSSCGSFVAGCDGTKIKAKDITSCVSGSPFYPCAYLTNSFQEGYDYTYKDCGGEPVNKFCYGGACVQCLTNSDCSGGKTCDLSTHICKSPVLCSACPDGTECGSCSSTNSGKRCVDVGGTGQLQADASCLPSPCTSCPDGTAVGSCSSSSAGKKCVSSGGTCSLQNDLACAGTGCSAWNGQAGNCNSAGGCHYCAILGTCLSASDTSCPGSVSCGGYTSQGACTQDGGSSGAPKPACTWCPNSYNGGTSPNGGACYGASETSGKCDSCFTTGTYYTSSGSYCRDACPYAAPGNGFVSGWCTAVMGSSGDYYARGCAEGWTGNCQCAGNKFDTAVNNNGKVDCGECAINANGKECGGTAVNGNMIYNGLSYAGNEAADVYGGAAVSPLAFSSVSGSPFAPPPYAITGGCDSFYDPSKRGTAWRLPNLTGYTKCEDTGSTLCPDCSSQVCGTYSSSYYFDACYSVGYSCAFKGYYTTSGAVKSPGCCPASNPYYNSADGKCYSQHGALGCADNIDNDRDCLVDCDDPDCSQAAACAGQAAKKSCGGDCGTCPSGQNCVSGVCQPSCVPKTSCSAGKNCGTEDNGCGGTVNCGTCSPGQNCVSGVCQLVPVPQNPVVSANPSLWTGNSGEAKSSTITVTDRNVGWGWDWCSLSATSSGSGTPTFPFPYGLYLWKEGGSGSSAVSYNLPSSGSGTVTVKADCGGGLTGSANIGWSVNPPKPASCDDAFKRKACNGHSGETIKCGCVKFICQ